jgi:CheY-like chemotaxis protein
VLVATILIVDPDPANRSLLELLVLRLGHRPIGQRELSEGEEPDLMLLEPASTPGLRLAHRLRAQLLRLPILCVSIEPPSEETSDLDVVDYVMKPFRRSTLELALERALVHARNVSGVRPTASLETPIEEVPLHAAPPLTA